MEKCKEISKKYNANLIFVHHPQLIIAFSNYKMLEKSTIGQCILDFSKYQKSVVFEIEQLEI